jgi:hypothetical protein
MPELHPFGYPDSDDDEDDSDGSARTTSSKSRDGDAEEWDWDSIPADGDFEMPRSENPLRRVRQTLDQLNFFSKTSTVLRIAVNFNFLCAGAVSLKAVLPNLFGTTVHAADVFRLLLPQNYPISGTTLVTHLSHSRCLMLSFLWLNITVILAPPCRPILSGIVIRPD